jgi:hypothetical protein
MSDLRRVLSLASMPEPWKPLTGIEELEVAARAPSTRKRYVPEEYAVRSNAPKCAFCGTSIFIEFYRVNGRLACSTCGVAARTGGAMGSASSFSQGLISGLGAAALGMVVYAAFTIVTHFYLGYVAIAVGWMIGKAMMKGSRGVGGPNYQVAAVILTYAAISLAAVPIRVAAFSAAGDMNWGAELFPLALWGLASPFLYLQYPIFGFVGFVLLIVGMRIAWRMTAARRMRVDGPHTVVVA